MKTLKYFGMMMLTMMMAFSMASCGSDKDKDDEGGGGGSSSSIVGSWYVVEEDTGVTSYTIMNYKSNGTLVVTVVFGYEGEWYKSSQSGTYKVSGNQVTINIAGDTGSGTWSVSGNKLIVDGQTFYKVDSKVQAIIDSATEYDL